MAHVISYAHDTEELNVARMLINFVDPLVDAGDVAQAVMASVDSLEAVPIAYFDNDELYDFRAQRPIVSYDNGRLVDASMPEINLDLVTDMHGEHFLYAYGQEPDFRWNTLTADLLDVVQRFGVKEVFSFAGIPAGVPHTRPADMMIRSTTRSDVQSVSGQADHFAQFQDLFEFRAGEQGISVTNIRVRVPFYMARGPFPFISGALAVIKMTAHLGGPTLPLGDLEQLEDRQMKDVKVVVEEGSDFAELLSRLEKEYDELPSNAGLMRPVDSLPRIPSAEEISQAAEQFLASLARDPLEEAKADDAALPPAAGLHSAVMPDSQSSAGKALESDKRKDGSRVDYEPSDRDQEQSGMLGLRAMFNGRLRRGKHHKDREDS